MFTLLKSTLLKVTCLHLDKSMELPSGNLQLFKFKFSQLEISRVQPLPKLAFYSSIAFACVGSLMASFKFVFVIFILSHLSGS